MRKYNHFHLLKLCRYIFYIIAGPYPCLRYNEKVLMSSNRIS